jgi:hypothetical protein
MSISKAFVLALAYVNFAASAVIAQDCPKQSATGALVASKARALEGRIIFHDGIRQWFELRLEQPQCGHTSIELMRIEGGWSPVEVLRGCRARSFGTIDLSGTGYFSLETYQAVERIEPVGPCVKQPPLPDYSKAKPDKSIRQYRVEMHVDYRPGDHPIGFRVSSGARDLQPWQAYASYTLTGGFVLYGHCADGFLVDKVFGTRQANPSHFDDARTSSDMAAFNPESAAQSGVTDLHLGYTCVRD